MNDVLIYNLRRRIALIEETLLSKQAKGYETGDWTEYENACSALRELRQRVEDAKKEAART
jgi:hypothetical protein